MGEVHRLGLIVDPGPSVPSVEAVTKAVWGTFDATVAVEEVTSEAAAAAAVYAQNSGKVAAGANQAATGTKKAADAADDAAGSYRDANGRLRDSKGRFLQVGESAEKAGGKVRKSGKDFASAGEDIKRMVASIVTVGAAMQGLRFSASSFGGLETGLISISKTTGLLGDEINGVLGGPLGAFSADLTALSTGPIPVVTSSLREIAAAAGQVGVSGAENLELYSTVFAKLAASSDLVGEDAVKQLTRLMNVQGEGPENVERLASVIVELGNNSAASESEIAHMSSEVGRSTSQFKIGSTSVAAYGTALASIGARAEGGGTAIGRTMREIQMAVSEGGDALAGFAEVAGSTAEDFAAQWRSSPVEAFNSFLQGLAESGADMGITLDKVGLKGDELAKVLPVLAENFGILEKAQRLASDEAEKFSDGLGRQTALDKEASAAFSTQDAALQSLANSWTATAEAVGGGMSPATRALTADLQEYLETNRDAAREIGEGLGGALSFAGTAFLGVAKNVDSLAAAAGILLALKIPAGIAAANVQLGTMNALLIANPFGVAVVGAAALVAILNTLATKSAAASVKAIDEITDSTRVMIKEWERVEKVVQSGTAAMIRSELGKVDTELEAITESSAAAAAETSRLQAEFTAAKVASSETWKALHEMKLGVEAAKIAESELTAESVLLRGRQEELQMALGSTDEAAIAAADALAKLKKEQAAAAAAAELAAAALQKLTAPFDLKIELAGVRVATQLMKDYGLSANHARDLAQAALDLESAGMSGRLAGLTQDWKDTALAIELARREQEAFARSEIRAATPGGDAISIIRAAVEFEPLDVGFDSLKQDMEELDVATGKTSEQLREQAEAEAAVNFESKNLTDGVGKTTEKMEGLGTAAILVSNILGDANSDLGRFGQAVANLIQVLNDPNASKAQKSAAGASVVSGAVSASGLAGGGQSQFGGELSSNESANFAEYGSTFGVYGAIIGAAIGLFVQHAAEEALVAFDETLNAAVVERAEGGLGPAAEALANAVTGFVQGFEELSGLDLDTAGVQLRIVGEVIQVTVNGAINGFRDMGSALAWMAEQLLMVNGQVDEFTAELGPNVAALIENLSNLDMSGSFEELQEALSLAFQLDANDAGASTGVASLVPEEMTQQIDEWEAQAQRWLEVGRQYGLSFESISALTNAALQKIMDGVATQAATLLGVTDFLGPAAAVAASMEALNTASSDLTASNQAAAAAAAQRRDDLQAEIDGLDKQTDGLTAGMAEGRGQMQGLTRDTAGMTRGMADTGMGDFGASITDASVSAFEGVKDFAALTRELEIATDEADALANAVGPDGFSAEAIADIFRSAADKTGLALLDLLDQIDGKEIDNATRRMFEKDLFKLQLAAQIASVQILLEMTELLDATTREALEGLVARGAEALADPNLSIGGGRGNGANRAARQAANRAAEQAAEDVANFWQSITDALADGSIDTLDEVRDLLAEAAAQPISALGDELIAQLEALEQVLAVAAAQVIRQAARDIEETMEMLNGIIGGTAGDTLAEMRLDVRRRMAQLRDDFAAGLIGVDKMAELEKELAQARRDATIALLGAIAGEALGANDALMGFGADSIFNAEELLKLEELRFEAARLAFELQIQALEITGKFTEEQVQNWRDLLADLDFSELAGQVEDINSTLGGSSSGSFGGSLPEADTFLDIVGAIEAWRRSVVGMSNPLAEAALQIEAQQQELNDRVNAIFSTDEFGLLDRIEEVAAMARTQLRGDIIASVLPEETGIESELAALLENFALAEDAMSTLFSNDTVAQAEALAELADAQAQAMVNFWEEQTAGIRSFLDELQANDPRVSSEERFIGARSNLLELEARFNAGDISVLDELEAAAREFDAQRQSFLGQGVGSNEALDLITRILGGVIDATPEIEIDPVVTGIDTTNDILASILSALERPDLGLEPGILAGALTRGVDLSEEERARLDIRGGDGVRSRPTTQPVFDTFAATERRPAATGGGGDRENTALLKRLAESSESLLAMTRDENNRAGTAGAGDAEERRLIREATEANAAAIARLAKQMQRLEPKSGAR